MTQAELARQPCQPRAGDTHRLDAERIGALLALLPGWTRSTDGRAIVREYRFTDFHHTLGFINAVGFLANRADHHPDLEAGYGHCRVRWSTHDCGGLSLNDFICAARIEQMLTPGC